MITLDFQFSGAGLIGAIVAALVLFALFRAIRRAGDALLSTRTYSFTFRRAFPVVESLTWILFTVWALGLIFTDPLSQSLALMTLLGVSVVWLSWFAARDFIAGLILRLQDDYEIGQLIRLDDIEGHIAHIGFLGIDVGRTGGEMTRIPYSRITGAVHSRRPPAAASRHVFLLHLSKEVSLSDTVNRVRTGALTSPWTSPDHEPEVRRVSEVEGGYILEVVVHGIGTDHFEAIERDIRNYMKAGVSS